MKEPANQKGVYSKYRQLLARDPMYVENLKYFTKSLLFVTGKRQQSHGVNEASLKA